MTVKTTRSRGCLNNPPPPPQWPPASSVVNAELERAIRSACGSRGCDIFAGLPDFDAIGLSICSRQKPVGVWPIRRWPPHDNGFEGKPQEADSCQAHGQHPPRPDRRTHHAPAQSPPHPISHREHVVTPLPPSPSPSPSLPLPHQLLHLSLDRLRPDPIPLRRQVQRIRHHLLGQRPILLQELVADVQVVHHLPIRDLRR